MSPSVRRWRAARDLQRARDLHGDSHPATWAAYGRALAAWDGEERLRKIEPHTPGNLQLACFLVEVASLAWRRTVTPGLDNRSERRARRTAALGDRNVQLAIPF